MTAPEQNEAFQKDLEALISRYCEEFDLTIAQAVGVLELVKLDLWHQHLEPCDEEE